MDIFFFSWTEKCWIANIFLGKSTARVSLRKYFIPGCVGRGLDLDLRIRPAAPAPAASGNPGFGPLGIEVGKQGFRTAWLITGRKFPWKNLKSGSSLLTFRDLSSYICEILLWIAKSGILDPEKGDIFKTPFFAGFWKMGPGHFSKISKFQNIMFQPFKKNSY